MEEEEDDLDDWKEDVENNCQSYLLGWSRCRLLLLSWWCVLEPLLESFELSFCFCDPLELVSLREERGY